jgi:hypothetical protein
VEGGAGRRGRDEGGVQDASHQASCASCAIEVQGVLVAV